MKAINITSVVFVRGFMWISVHVLWLFLTLSAVCAPIVSCWAGGSRMFCWKLLCWTLPKRLITLNQDREGQPHWPRQTPHTHTHTHRDAHVHACDGSRVLFDLHFSRAHQHGVKAVTPSQTTQKTCVGTVRVCKQRDRCDTIQEQNYRRASSSSLTRSQRIWH